MAFLHSTSCECVKSELDIFSTPPTQTTIEDASWIVYKPIAAITSDSPIEFCCPNASSDYTDLSQTLLSLKAKIVKNTPNVAVHKDTGPVNNFIHSLFNQVDVYLNQKLVSPLHNSYLETLLNYGCSAKKSHLSSSVWYTDSSGHMDGTPANNKGLSSRRELFADEKTVDMISPLHVDLFHQDKFLINGVESRLRLIRSRDALCLIDPENTAKIEIVDASLILRRVKISPGILIAHAKALAQSPAKYPVCRTEVKCLAIQSGVHGTTLDNIVLGQIPKRVIIGFVDNKSFNGDKKLNPFNFKNYGINYLTLFVEENQVPSRALQPNFTDSQFTD